MRYNPKICTTLFIAILFSFPLLAQQRFFSDISDNQINKSIGKRVLIPNRFRTTRLDIASLRNFLQSLPLENPSLNREQAPIIELPMPNGNMGKFHVWQSPIMEPGLAARYPEIRTFAGQGIDDPYASIRFDFNPYFGFSAQVISIHGNIMIDPYAKGNTEDYISYYTSDNSRNPSFECKTIADAAVTDPEIASRVEAGPCRGTLLYTYRLALACTGEYATAVCSPNPPTIPATLAAMTTSVNRVDGVYESELTVRLLLVSNTDLLIYTDGTSDPYTNNSGGSMLGENQLNIDNIIGTDNYDIGHVFSTGGGGVAGLQVVCSFGNKARGVTGLSFPVGDNFDIDYVAHEMGHQFGGSHTFNSTTGSCGGGNRSGSSAYEVGSGTTIMAYAGICGTNNTQPHSDAFFHTRSFDQVSNFLENGGTCRGIISTGNLPPVITAMNNNGANIPANTPFTLTASASDANGDAITYCWEEWDLGSPGDWNAGASDMFMPLFKSRVPKTTGSRTFPDIAVILAGYPPNPAGTMGGLKGETLPLIGRPLKFRLTVRDNRAGGGGITTGGEGCQGAFAGTFQVNVIDATGPFVVTAPNGGESWPGNTNQTITWNVAGTASAPISCANVKISLSTDGGLTFPTVIAASTPNDGTESLTIPDLPTATARVKIEGIGNIFFDISDQNFMITAAPTGFGFSNPAPANIPCGGASGQLTLDLSSIGGYNTPVNLTASGNPPGTNVIFNPSTVIPGNSTIVTLNNTQNLSFGSYNVTVTGTSGAIIKSTTVTFVVQQGVGPAISQQPQSQQVCVGNNVTFTVASPGALSYQWLLSTDGGGSYNNIPTATSSSYTVFGVTVGMNNYRYKCAVTGQCGTTNSNAAILTVLTAPAISGQPQNASVCTGGGNTFNVFATGAGLNYQWQLSTDGGGSFNPIGGANASSYTVMNASLAMNNYKYKVIITGTCSPTATSSVATLSVSSPVTITTQPINVTICETGNVSFVVAGTGANTIYQWQISTNGGSSYSDIPGGNAATLMLTSVSLSMNGNLYRALLSNPICTTPTASNAALLTVTTRPSVTIAAAPYTKLYPGLFTQITATTVPATGLIYFWYRNGTIIPTAITKSIIVGVTGLGDYKVTIVDPLTGCNNTSSILTISDSITAKVFIYPNPNNGQFTVTYYNGSVTATQQSVTVYDSRGAKVYHGIFDVSGPYQLHSIDIKHVERGLYYVIIGDSHGRALGEGKVAIINQ